MVRIITIIIFLQIGLNVCAQEGQISNSPIFFKDGNIGIGRTNPNSKLEIGIPHSYNQDEEIRIGSYYEDSFYGLGLNYRINSFGGVSKHLVSYHSGIRYDLMSFFKGNVGIGTSGDPNSKLHINAGYNAFLVNGVLGGNNYQDYQASFTFTDTGIQESGIKLNKKNGACDFNLLNAFYNNKELFVIRSNGNVGIGVKTPRDLLHIAAGTNEGIYIGNRDKLNWDGTGEQPGYHIRFAGYRDVAGDVTGARISALRTNSCCSGKSQGMELAFYVTTGMLTNSSGDVNLKEAMRINDNGNIAIGKSSADYKLDVEGTIRANEIRVEDIAATNLKLEGNIAANQITVKANGNTADFVFSDSYNLKDLTEVENYIKTHKHLPDIPSAEEMEASGVNLAEMNKLLLQKVEELTLYVIDKDKEVSLLKNQLEIQNKKM